MNKTHKGLLTLIAILSITISLLSFINSDQLIVNSPKTINSYIKTIDVTNKSIAFSKIAKPGKVTVFILSAHWCKPCKVLRDQLDSAMKRGLINPNEVDIYYCLLSKGKNDKFKSMNNRTGYKHFKHIDQLTEVFPTTYILTPTTNTYTIVSGNKYNDILSYISELTNLKNKFFDINSLITSIDQLTFIDPYDNPIQSNSVHNQNYDQRKRNSKRKSQVYFENVSCGVNSNTNRIFRFVLKFSSDPGFGVNEQISNKIKVKQIESNQIRFYKISGLNLKKGRNGENYVKLNDCGLKAYFDNENETIDLISKGQILLKNNKFNSATNSLYIDLVF